MRAITKHSPAATAAAPRRWFHTVQWVRNDVHRAPAPSASGFRPASWLLRGTLAAMVITIAAR